MTRRSDIPAWYARAIAQRPHHVELDIGEIHIHCRVWGDESAPTVLLLHGGAAHSGWWDHVAPALSADHRVVAPDLSGHGDSGRRASYSNGEWATEVLEVSRAFGGTEATSLVGHSRSGMVAIVADELAATPFRTLVVIEAAFGLKTPPARRRSDGTIADRTYDTEDAILGRFRLMPEEPVPDFIAAHVAAESVRETAAGWTWKFDRGIQGVPPLELGELEPAKSRTTLVRSDNGLCDPAMDVVAADRLQAEQVVVPGGGHNVMLRKPRELVDVISGALAEEAV